METVAVYWEKQIKIYGVSERAGLTLVQLLFPQAQLEIWGKRIEALGNVCNRFELVLVQKAEKDNCQLSLIIGQEDDALLLEHLPDQTRAPSMTHLFRHSPVATVFFHGPHFQDRFGIAHATAKVLDVAKTTILASGYSGTSVYVVIPEEQKDMVVSAITETFLVPQSRS